MKPEDNPAAGKKTKYFFFLDGQKYEMESSSVSGATIRAKLPPEKAGYAVYLEAQGNAPDEQVQDTSAYSLEKNPPRFYSVPPATFGNEPF